VGGAGGGRRAARHRLCLGRRAGPDRRGRDRARRCRRGVPDGRAGVDGVLQLQVSGAGTERLTAAGPADLADNTPVTLAFAPIEDSAGETFTLTFTYAGARPLALYANPYDPYLDGGLVDRDGDLVFVLGHADRVGGTLDALGRVAGETADRATSDLAFLVVWLLLVAGAGALVVRTRRSGGRACAGVAAQRVEQ
jgi:hypothetical protein